MSLSAPSRTANAVDDAHQLTPSSLGESFATQIETATRKAGLTFAVSSAREDEKHFGNALVTGRLGPFGASFVRDHGQIFLELGPADAPGPAHYRSFQDIQLFLRWTSMDELLAREQVEEIDEVLRQIASRWTELVTAFRNKTAWERVDAVASERGRALIRRLRQ